MSIHNEKGVDSMKKILLVLIGEVEVKFENMCLEIALDMAIRDLNINARFEIVSVEEAKAICQNYDLIILSPNFENQKQVFKELTHDNIPILVLSRKELSLAYGDKILEKILVFLKSDEK